MIFHEVKVEITLRILRSKEFMILPVGASSFREAMCIGAEVYHNLKSVIKKKYGQDACNVGDEGGFAPSVQDNNEAFINSVREKRRKALDVLMEAIEKSGHKEKVKIGTDVAASEFYSAKTLSYVLGVSEVLRPRSTTWISRIRPARSLRGCLGLLRSCAVGPDSMKKSADEMIAYYKDRLRSKDQRPLESSPTGLSNSNSCCLKLNYLAESPANIRGLNTITKATKSSMMNG